jgi:Fe-S-cluster containining protein
VEPWAIEARKVASCKRGCNNCCYQLIGASLAEGALIAAHVMESPAWLSELRTLRTRLQEDTNEIRTMAGPKSKSYQWMENKKGCPFLDKKSGDCRIYNVRPIACRTYFVVSEPGNCSPDKPGAEVKIIDPSEATGPAIEGIARTRDEIPSATGSLQSMVLAGMELISHSPATFKKWMAGRQVDDLSKPADLIRSA